MSFSVAEKVPSLAVLPLVEPQVNSIKQTSLLGYVKPLLSNLIPLLRLALLH